jgi:hypothetical protein
MNLKTYGNYQLLHEGNHNELGNPHAQYAIPLNFVGGASSTGTYTKIMSTYPIPNAYNSYLYLKAELVSHASTLSNTGQLILHVVGNGSGGFNIRQFSVENFSNPNIFVLYKRTVDANTFALDLYMQSILVTDQLKFIPTICDFSPNKDWTAFRFFMSQHGSSPYVSFLANQPYVSTISDSLVATSSLKQIPIKSLQYLTNTITSGSTIDATNLATALLNYSSATNVTGFNNYIEGQIVTLHALNGNATLVHSGSSFALKGGTNVTLTIGQNITMRRISSLWAEIGRNF